jgi:hypothetical protein
METQPPVPPDVQCIEVVAQVILETADESSARRVVGSPGTTVGRSGETR